MTEIIDWLTSSKILCRTRPFQIKIQKEDEKTRKSQKNCRQSLDEPISKQTGTTLDPQTATIFLLPNKRQTVWLRIHRRDGFREQSNEAFWIIRCLLNALCHSKQQLNRGRMKARPLIVRLRFEQGWFHLGFSSTLPTSSGPTPPSFLLHRLPFFSSLSGANRKILATDSFVSVSFVGPSLVETSYCIMQAESWVPGEYETQCQSLSLSLSLSFSQWRAPGSRAQLKFWYVSILLCFLPFLRFFHFAFVPRCFSTMFHGGSSIIFLWFRKGFQLKRRNTVGVNGCVGLSTRLNFSDELAVLKSYFFRCL